MKPNSFSHRTILYLAPVLWLLAACASYGQGTSFTYQGRLSDGGSLATGSYDMQFVLFDAATAGNTIGSTLTTNAVSVSNGLFTVTLNFFGGVFTGPGRWLAISVKTNGAVSYAAVLPRQAITATPYAMYAGAVSAAGVSGSIPAAQLSGTLNSSQLSGTYSSQVIFNNGANSFTGNGESLSNLNAANLTGTIADARLSTNVVLSSAAPTFTGSNNFSGVLVATNAGNQLAGNGDGLSNLNAASLTGTIADARLSTNVVLFGAAQNFTGSNSFIGVLVATNAGNQLAGNGAGLTALNPANLTSGTAPISISGNAATASNATTAASAASFSGSLAGDVTGTQGSTLVTSVGGQTAANITRAVNLALAGTAANSASNLVLRDAAGNFSAGTITANSFVGDGSGLTGISGGGGTVSNAWSLNGNNLDTTQFLGSTNNQAVELRVNGSRALRLEPNAAGANFIAGSATNFVAAGVTGATIGGGSSNAISAGAFGAVIDGGAANTNGGNRSVIGGGELNSIGATATHATVPGGLNNAATGTYSFAAGQRAKANHRGAFVWADSQAADFASTGTNQFLVRAQGGVGVNTTNLGTATFSVLGNQTGGWSNSVSVFQNTNTGANISPALRVVTAGNTADGALSVSANGTGLIARFGNAINWVADMTTNGTMNALAFNPTSDRNAKQNFQPIDPRAVLDKVARLNITEWNFKAAPDESHIGPMAQDFRAAFGLGTDDKHIATVDADGVALAAIQGLNQRLKEKDAEIQDLKQSVAELKQQMQALSAKK